MYARCVALRGAPPGLAGRIASHFGRWRSRLPCAAGLHLAALAAADLTAEALVRRTAAGIGVRSLRDFQHGAPGERPGCFGFGALDNAALQAALAALRQIL